MAFSDLIHSFMHSHASDDDEATSLVDQAVELYNRLDEDPNDIEAFEDLAALIRNADSPRSYVDPLRGDTERQDSEDEYSADLVLWSLSEEIGSASTAWYPLIQLARLSINNDQAAAIRYLEIAVDREDTGIALAEAIKVLREAGQYDAAIQLGLGRWQPQTQSPSVGEELIEAALGSGKTSEAEHFLQRMREANVDPELIDELAVQIATQE